MKTQKIALLGLGAMGAAIAARWRAEGFPLTVWNRNRAKAEALGFEPDAIAATPREAAAGAAFVAAMVTDDDASRAVWLGEEGALAGAGDGSILIDFSTVTPGCARDLEARARKKGVAFLDAPVAGGPAVAAAGRLTIFAGGDRSAFDKARPLFDAIAARVEHLGPAGAGATWKLVNYMMAGAQLASLCEALTLALKAGVEPSRAGDLITGSVVASPLVVSKIPRLVARDYDNPDATLDLVAKDQRYMVELARSLNARLEIAPVVAEIFRRAEAEGYGAHDLTAVFESVRKRSGA